MEYSSSRYKPIDLKDLSTLNNISIDEIISHIVRQPAIVLSMGFLPGFLYLGMNHKNYIVRERISQNLI